MLSEQSKWLQERCFELAAAKYPTHFTEDYHQAALHRFADLPHGEKLARAMAYAITNQNIWVYKEDRIGGRIYYNDGPVTEVCPGLDYKAEGREKFLAEYPEAKELMENQLIAETAFGHITWNFDQILSLGVKGFRTKVQAALENAKDEKAVEFCGGVLIMLDALQDFNDKHIAAYEALGCHELAQRMKKVPRYPCETFEEAVQAFFMQHIVVMRENPFGGNGPGWLDRHLWPYLEKDLAAGRCTLEQAREIIDELFLRIDERIHERDTWVEAVVVGGTNPDGTSAANPLTYIMVESIIDLNISHPSIYIRLPKDPPDELLKLCARYMTSGNNRAQILNDVSIIDAQMRTGKPFADASNYACGGCMEVAVQGRTSDLLFFGWQNTPKMLELMVTGGVCLRTGKKLRSFHAEKGLPAYGDFESFYHDFIEEAGRITEICLREQDIYSEILEKNRPAYLISSMVDDCLARGRNIHGGGAVYHDYGGTQLGMPNVADGLFAIKKAVFDEKFCTAQELVDALKADFKGYEVLQARLRAVPKYGVDNEEADAMARRVMSDFADLYLHYRNRLDGIAKPVILTFVYSPQAAEKLGATPDGRNAGLGVAYGVTPHSASMTQGITAAINSCGRMPFEKFAGGASSMWDFDSAWASEEVVEAILRVFLAKGGQIFQGNTVQVEALLDAQQHPEAYGHLMVRVGGYSARFVTLDAKLQASIIERIRHCC